MNREECGPNQPSSSAVSITVLSVTPARAINLFAFASIEIDIDGLQIGVHGIRAMHAGPDAVAIELPKFRDADGMWRTAITLPEEIYTPIARAVLDELVARGPRYPRRMTAGCSVPRCGGRMSGKATCVCHLEKIATSDPLIAGMLWSSRFSLGLARTWLPRATERALGARLMDGPARY
jgi:stage V sporulation protein G